MAAAIVEAHGIHAGDATDIDKARLHLPLVCPI